MKYSTIYSLWRTKHARHSAFWHSVYYNDDGGDEEQTWVNTFLSRILWSGHNLYIHHPNTAVHSVLYMSQF